MKKILLALITIIGLTAIAPKAEAGQFARVYTKHGPVYLHKSQLYGYNNNSYYGSRRHKHHRNVYYGNRYYGSRPYYSRGYSRSYYRPSYVSYPSYNNYGYSRPSCGYQRRPHISVAFGF